MPTFPSTWFNLQDSAVGELSAEISAAATSLAVKSGQGAKFPSSDFIFRCENEWIHCATRTTDTFNTLTRGYSGTTAAIHAVNSTVFQSAGKSLFQRIYDNLDGHTHAASDISGTAVLTNDSRLSDARTPLTHSITSAHNGFPGGTTNFLRADGAFAAPPGGGGGMNLLRTTADQTINAGAGVFTDITDLTFSVVSGTDYAFEFYITFQSAATATGWKAGVNCPAGTLDFWAGSDVIANGAAGVATHTERHNTVRDDMTLLTTTVTQAVDLNVRIKGRYLCTANGTFAARFANELASNTNIVVQKGSWGWWF
jgi:hypothetical protein